MKVRKLLLLLFGLLFLFPTNTYALSCAQLPSIEQAYENYDAVVIAYVDDIVRKRQSNEIQLTVLNSFKGIQDRKLVMEEDMTWGTSERGTQYLYFLRKKDGGGWENPLCSPMQKVTSAAKALDFLKEKEIAVKDAEFPKGAGSTNWVEVSILVVVLGLLGYGLVRWVKRRNE
ncbi:hypothetical protein HQN90_32710 [Paenibacillus alba]|uniref:hypothetical protein n=1 Tax=Paenibacillus alba TaxID=1197127 RepID=UPI001564EBD4|nr:hypothetical protein [Paenibacillus alba]NQX70905.1 hypothetical protein [Paenibacillus alba]